MPRANSSLRRLAPGFTLVEAIIVIVVTGILAGVVAVFITSPVQSYADSVRRAELTDAADVSLRYLVREVRLAVPNSLRIDCASVSGWCYLEFVPTKDGGRYRSEGDGSSCGIGTAPYCLCRSSATQATFDVLGIANGGNPPAVKNDYIVVYNDASLGSGPSCTLPANVYCATGSRAQVLSVTAATASASARITTTAALANSPDLCLYTNNRFQVVDKDVQAVTYACPTATVGTLTRYSKYGFNPVQSTILPPGGTASTVINNATCVMDSTLVQGNTLLYIKLTVTDSASGERIEAFREVSLDNTL